MRECDATRRGDDSPRTVADVGMDMPRMRTLPSLIVALSLTGVSATPASAATRQWRNKKLEHAVLKEINAVRARHHLKPVRASVQLWRASLRHAAAMGRRGYFEHDSLDGTPWDRRILRFYDVAKSRRWGIGENILWASDDVEPADAVKMWMDSPGHRKNMLDPEWREVGVGAVAVRNGPGVFEGLDVSVIVTDFGVR